MILSRRTLLGSLAAMIAAPSPAWAEGSPNEALVATFRERMVGFDVLAVARRILTEARLEKWIPEVEARIGAREHARGLRSINGWSRDEAYATAVSELIDEMSKDLGTRLAIRRLAKRAPETREAQQALLDHIVGGWFDIDVPAMREAAAALPEEGLLVVMGPPRDLWEVLASAVSAPFVHFLELVHGRRATIWAPHTGSKRELLEALLAPEHRVVAFLGHGSWTGFSLSGLSGDPAKILDRVFANVRESPRQYLPGVLANDPRRAIPSVAWRRDTLDEPDLAALVAQVGLSRPKDLVVRHTCGYARYLAEDASLLWDMLPADLEPAPLRWGLGLSARYPEHQGRWEAPLDAWLADKAVVIAEAPALGTCLVASPADTRGYEGKSWLPDFVEAPIPDYDPPHVWVTRAAEAG